MKRRARRGCESETTHRDLVRGVDPPEDLVKIDSELIRTIGFTFFVLYGQNNTLMSRKVSCSRIRRFALLGRTVLDRKRDEYVTHICTVFLCLGPARATVPAVMGQLEGTMIYGLLVVVSFKTQLRHITPFTNPVSMADCIDATSELLDAYRFKRCGVETNVI